MSLVMVLLIQLKFSIKGHPHHAWIHADVHVSAVIALSESNKDCSHYGQICAWCECPLILQYIAHRICIFSCHS